MMQQKTEKPSSRDIALDTESSRNARKSYYYWHFLIFKLKFFPNYEHEFIC